MPARKPARFRWLTTVDESFECMLKAIREAQSSICLEMYIYSASPIGETFRNALAEAARRGVVVRVLIDSFGSITLPTRFWDPLVEAGGQFRWFNPLTLGRCGFRDHRKLLVCDDDLAFAGGFNISPEYEGDGVNKGWHDLGIQLSGPLAKELAASFDSMFHLADFKHPWLTRLRRPPVQNIVSTHDGQLLMSAPGRGRNYLRHSLLHDLVCPKSVKIISAYFLPTRNVRRALHRLARVGVQVQLILAGKSDVPMSRLASHRFYAGFLRSGVEIYEYEPQILHSKLFLIDDIVYVGSANLDRRSFYINYEIELRLPDPELASEARRIFQDVLLHSKRIDAAEWRKSRTFWNLLKERWAFFILARLDPLIARRQLKTLR